MSTQTILVFGATGKQGNAVIKALLKLGGFRVLAVTRDVGSEKAQALSALDGVEVVQGEIGQHEHLFDGQQVHGLFFVHVGFDIEKAVSDSKSLIDLAVQKGVKHIVFSGTDFLGHREEGLGLPFLDCKVLIENHIRSVRTSASGGVETTILRPVGFFENFYMPGYKDQITTTWNPENPFKMIAVADIGGIAAQVFAHPEQWDGEELNIAGESLKPAEIVKIWKDVTGVTLDATEPPAFPPPLSTAMDFFANNPFDADVEWNKKNFPWLKDLKTWLAESTFAKPSA